MSWENVLLKLLKWGLANFFYKTPESNYFRHMGQEAKLRILCR